MEKKERERSGNSLGSFWVEFAAASLLLLMVCVLYLLSIRTDSFSRFSELLGVLLVSVPMLLLAWKNASAKNRLCLVEATMLYLVLYSVLYDFIWVQLHEFLSKSSGSSPDLSSLITFSFLQMIMVLVPLLWWRKKGFGLDRVGITRENFWRGINCGTLVGIAWGTLALFWTMMARAEWLSLPSVQTMLLRIANAFFVGLAEETVYRGVVQTELTQALGSGPALFLTAISFCLIHGWYFALPPATLFFTLILGPLSGGFILGFLFNKEGLHAAITCHFVFDAILYAFFF